MSQATLFGFGAVIFFIVITGAFLYGLAVSREAYEKTNNRRLSVRGYYSLDEDGEPWRVIHEK